MIAGAMDTYRYTAIVQQSFCAAKALIRKEGRKEGRKEVNNYENLPLSTSLKISTFTIKYHTGNPMFCQALPIYNKIVINQ
ncbi:hypothetical protein ATY38_10450 [Nitrosomonas ureae]|nr:hypothetical protein ATY38_10450 [Nitrosomonas ureae]